MPKPLYDVARNYQEAFQPLQELGGALLSYEEMTGGQSSPYLQDVAPGLMGGASSSFASKELNQGRGAVTGGRAFRSPRVRSKDGETVRAGTEESNFQSEPVAYPDQSWRTETERGEHDYGSGQGYTKEESEDLIAMHGGAGGSTQGSAEPGQVGMGFVTDQLAPNLGMAAINTGLMGAQLGASAGDYVGAAPGTVAAGVKGAMMGPVGNLMSQIGMSDAVAGPVGAANTMLGMAGTQMASEWGLDRAATQMQVDPEDISTEAKRKAQQAAGTWSTPLGSFGALGLSIEGLLSMISGYDSPIEQAQKAGALQMGQELDDSIAGKDLGYEMGVETETPAEQPSMLDQAQGYIGDAVTSGLQGINSALGGYDSMEAAEEAGFTYNIGENGQISIDPPSMNLGGLDDKLGLSAQSKERARQVEDKIGALSDEEKAIAAKYSKTKKAIDKIEKARREANQSISSSWAAYLERTKSSREAGRDGGSGGVGDGGGYGSHGGGTASGQDADRGWV